MLFLFFFPCFHVPLFLWVPEKILSLYDCGLSQEGALALGRKGLFPLSHDCPSIHLSVHLSIHPPISQYTPGSYFQPGTTPGAMLFLKEPSTGKVGPSPGFRPFPVVQRQEVGL